MLNEYDIQMERKAISSNYNRLKELGFKVISKNRGAYLDRENSTFLGCGFSNTELHLLIDSIRCNRYLSVPSSNTLIKKLEQLSNEHFAHSLKNVHFLGDWDKTDNLQVFETVQMINQAITKNLQIRIQYGKYEIDKKLHESSNAEWSPYLLFWHNQRYYLMAHNEKYKNMGFLRVDQMLSVEVLSDPRTDIRKVEGYKNGINTKT